MSSPTANLRLRNLRMLVISAILTLFALTAWSATASAAPLQLQWTQAKVYESPQALPNVNRTWLGYLTRGGSGPAYANGTTTPSDGLAGPTVTVSSPSGPYQLYTWAFGASAGSLSGNSSTPAALAGTVDFSGTLTYDSPAPPAGHGIHIEISNPRVVLNGDGTGALIASGKGISPTPGAPGYDPSDPDYGTYSNLKIFDLDLSGAISSPGFGGSTVITGIAPALASTAPKFFTGGYPVGSGPDRTPNTFGTFSIVIPPAATPPAVVEPTAKTKTIHVKTSKKSIFRTRHELAVRVTLNKKIVGYATVQGKTVHLRYFTSTFEKGTYRLTTLAGKHRSVKVKLG